MTRREVEYVEGWRLFYFSHLYQTQNNGLTYAKYPSEENTYFVIRINQIIFLLYNAVSCNTSGDVRDVPCPLYFVCLYKIEEKVNRSKCSRFLSNKIVLDDILFPNNGLHVICH